MDLAALGSLEARLKRSPARAVVVDPRLLRKVIKGHRDLEGLTLTVPHGRCYALKREALLALVDPVEIGVEGHKLPPSVILVARPTPRELGKRDATRVLRLLWRASFHASLHLALEDRVESGELSAPAIRERIDRIGQTEFDEIRAILRHDDLLLPPYGDAETYTEFAALFLELHTSPRRSSRSPSPACRRASRWSRSWRWMSTRARSS